MGISSTNGGLNGELERSSTAPWERGSDGTTASAGEPNATGAPRAKSGKTAKGGKKNG